MIDNITNTDLLQRIFDSSVEGILVVNDKGLIIKANPSAEHLFGYGTEELLHKKMEDLIQANFRSIYKNNMEAYLKKPDDRLLGDGEELLGLKKNGNTFSLDATLNPSQFNGESVVIAFVRDNARCVLANKTSKTSKDEMLEAQKMANVGSWSWDLKTNKRIWSDEFYRICGLLPGDERLNAQTATQFIHPDDQEDALYAVYYAIENQSPYNFEKRIVRPDGTIRYVVTKGKAVYSMDGKPISMMGTIQDITNFKKIEEKLSLSETRNKAILKALPDIIFVLNKEGIYLDVHSTDSSLLILPEKELFGKNIYDVLPKQLCDKIINAFNKSEKTRKTQIIEYSLSVKDELRYFEARIVVKENGNFLTIIRDITDNKHNETLIRESEERFRLAMLATHDGFYDFNPKTDKGWYSQKYIDQFKPTKEKNWWEHNIHPDDKERILKAIDSTLNSKNNYWINEYRLKSNNKSYIYVEDRGYIVRDEQGKAIRVLGAVGDISERNKAEQLAKESRQKLRDYAVELEEKVDERTKELKATVQQLVESNLNLEDQILITKAAENKALNSQAMFSAIAKDFPKGIITVINKDFEILYCGGEGLSIMGLENIDLNGLKINEIEVFSEERKARLKNDVRETLKGRHLSFEINYNDIAFSVSTSPLFDKNQKIDRALLVYNDINHQKKVEQEIRNTLQKEQELNELKSRFIAMASHEFRTPLTAILSSAILIGKQNEAGKEEKRDKYVGQIKSNVKNLVSILNDFLSLSKLEEGKVVANLESFNIIEFSKSIIEEFELTKKKGQSITFINDYPATNTYLDSKLIHHILTNLLSNAIKYSEKNKDITLRISSEDERIFLAVIDQGIGIPINDQKNMFNRFYRAKNSTNIEGTGLGLSIVKQYSELMNGTVSFKSKLNEGSTFIVELPINQKR